MNGEPPFGQPGPLPFGQPRPTLKGGTPGLNASTQFSLRSLFGFTTICCLIAALSSVIGLTAGLFLMAFALALLTRNGTIALIMLTSASLTAGIAGPDYATTGFLNQLALFPSAALICLWYLYRSPVTCL